MNRPFLLTAVAICAVVLSACQSNKHEMVKPQSGQTAVCTQCYDQIRKARSHHGPRGGQTSTRTITTHQCDQCKTEMSIYDQDGVLMVKCAKCAPEGVACDKCVPREPTAN